MITPAQAADRAAAHLGAQLQKGCRSLMGWPQGAYRNSAEPVWTIWFPPELPRTGASRYLIISQTTGRVIADGFFGE